MRNNYFYNNFGKMSTHHESVQAVLQKRPICSGTWKSQAVLAFSSSKVTPSAMSTSVRSPAVRSTLNTARSVTIMLTARGPVNGKEHSLTIFGTPSFEQCCIVTITFVLSGFETRSIAPPIPGSTSQYPVIANIIPIMNTHP